MYPPYPFCVVFHVFTCFCLFHSFHFFPPSWRQQRWHEGWRTLLRLQGRQIWLLCSPWQCILAACRTGMRPLERWFDNIWYRWAVVFVVLWPHLCCSHPEDHGRRIESLPKNRPYKWWFAKAWNSHHRQFCNVGSNACILTVSHFTCFCILLLQYAGIIQHRVFCCPKKPLISRLKWAISQSWIPLHPTKSFSKKKCETNLNILCMTILTCKSLQILMCKKWKKEDKVWHIAMALDFFCFKLFAVGTFFFDLWNWILVPHRTIHSHIHQALFVQDFATRNYSSQHCMLDRLAQIGKACHW